MKKVERQYLFRQKLKDGKEADVADFEIQRDDCYNRNIKYDFSSLQKKVKLLEKENEFLRKIQKKNIVPTIKEERIIVPRIVRPRIKSCTVTFLNRILNYMKENKNLTATTISQELCLDRDTCMEGLNFLFKNKLIRRRQDCDTIYYSGL